VLLAEHLTDHRCLLFISQLAKTTLAPNSILLETGAQYMLFCSYFRLRFIVWMFIVWIYNRVCIHRCFYSYCLLQLN